MKAGEDIDSDDGVKPLPVKPKQKQKGKQKHQESESPESEEESSMYVDSEGEGDGIPEILNDDDEFPEPLDLVKVIVKEGPKEVIGTS